MRTLARKYKTDTRIRETALNLIADLPQKAWGQEIKRLHAFVRDHIRYVKDIHGVETVHTPIKILTQAQGDCDDKSLILATLLETIGHPTRFVAVGPAPSIYSHVYVETKLGNKWIPLETTENVKPGWAPKNTVSRMVIFN